MKNTLLALVALITLAASSFAGPSKAPACFASADAPEVSNVGTIELIPFAAYTQVKGDGYDFSALGGGIAMRYFLTENNAIELAGTAYEHDFADLGWTGDINYIHGLFGTHDITVYGLIGGGVGYVDTIRYYLRGGVGVEYSISEKIGLFVDTSYAHEFEISEHQWGSRIGLKFSF